MIPYPNFLGGSGRSQNAVAFGEQSMNFYLEKFEHAAARGPGALYPTPGYRFFGTVAGSPGRGTFTQSGRTFGVCGTNFFEITADGVTVVRGIVVLGDSPATISGNGFGRQLLVTSGGHAHVYHLDTGSWTEVLSTAVVMGVMLDGYFIVLQDDSSIRISGLRDGLTWDPLLVAPRDAATDPWLAIVVLEDASQILLVGELSADLWYNSGARPFPFVPIPNARIPFGTSAAFSVRTVNSSAVWLAQNKDGTRQVIETIGASAKIITTHELATELGEYARVDDARGDSYQEDNHTFFLLTFPSVGKTWVYDFTTEKWHERGTWIAEENRYDALRGLFHVSCFDKHLVQDRLSGNLYEQTKAVGLDVDDRPIRRIRQPQGLWNLNKRVVVGAFELYCEVGLGVTGIGPGSLPTVSLQWSKNGGKTWGNEAFRDAGRQGEYESRGPFWTRCGSSLSGMTPRVVMTDPIPWRLSGAGVLLG